MAEQRPQDQVYNMQTQPEAANIKIPDLEAKVIYPLEACSGTDMI